MGGGDEVEPLDHSPRGWGRGGAGIDPSDRPIDAVFLGVKDGHVSADSICGRVVRGVRVRVAVEDCPDEGVCFQRCFGGSNGARGGSRGVGAPCTGARAAMGWAWPILGGCVRYCCPFFCFIDRGGGALFVVSGDFCNLLTCGSSANRTVFVTAIVTAYATIVRTE